MTDNPTPAPAEALRHMAERIHFKLAAAQNLPYKDGDTCEECRYFAVELAAIAAAPTPQTPAPALGYCDRHRWLHEKDRGPSLPPFEFPCENWKAETPASARPDARRCSCDMHEGIYCPVHRDEFRAKSQGIAESEARVQSEPNADSPLGPDVREAAPSASVREAALRLSKEVELRRATPDDYDEIVTNDIDILVRAAERQAQASEGAR